MASSSKRYVFAVKIILSSSVSAETDAGIYTDSLRWIQSDISSYSPTIAWTANMLLRDGIGSISMAADFLLGGDLPTIGGTTIKVGNSFYETSGETNNQLDATLESKEIYLPGLKCQIYRFEISGGALVDADGTVIFYGLCGSPTSTESVFEIPIETTGLKRRSNLSTKVGTGSEQNVIVPVTFGKYKQRVDNVNNVIINQYAKAYRTQHEIAVWDNDRIVETFGAYPHGEKQFPIYSVQTTPTLSYSAQISLSTRGYISSLESLPSNMYVRVTEGDGNSEIRKVESWSATGGKGVYFTVDRYFKTTLTGNATATATNNSWVEFFTYAGRYKVDIWPCYGFLRYQENSSILYEVITSDTAKQVEAYSYEQNDTVTISALNTKTTVIKQDPSYKFIQRGVLEAWDFTLKNILLIIPIFCEDNVEKSVGYTLLPPSEVYAYSEDDLSNFRSGGWPAGSYQKGFFDGIYPRIGTLASSLGYAYYGVYTNGIQDATNADDKDHTTFANGDWNYGTSHPSYNLTYTWDYIWAFAFKPPVLPDTLDFDSVYLLVNMSTRF